LPPPAPAPPPELPPAPAPPFDAPPFDVPPALAPPFDVPPFALPPALAPPFELPPALEPPFELPPDPPVAAPPVDGPAFAPALPLDAEPPAPPCPPPAEMSAPDAQLTHAYASASGPKKRTQVNLPASVSMAPIVSSPAISIVQRSMRSTNGTLDIAARAGHEGDESRREDHSGVVADGGNARADFSERHIEAAAASAARFIVD
jgi:hypothetical protein